MSPLSSSKMEPEASYPTPRTQIKRFESLLVRFCVSAQNKSEKVAVKGDSFAMHQLRQMRLIHSYLIIII